MKHRLQSREIAVKLSLSRIASNDNAFNAPLPAEEQRWRVGAVQPLGDDDDSPFLGTSNPVCICNLSF